jgi:glycosyltransferase involved in cell wall biosynthesis
MYYAVNRHWPEVIIANSDRAWRAAEAMAAGLPVVATDVGDIRRLVAEGVNGFVVTCDQQAEHSMTSALARLLTDPGLRSRMSAAVLIAYDKAGWKQKLTGSKADLLLNSPA